MKKKKLTNLPCATLFWGTLELGRHFGSTTFNLLYIFTCKSYEKYPKKSQINNACTQCEPETNHFIEQYEWTIGVWITVQIGERGKFTDVQIGERGKQRVNAKVQRLLTKL